MAVTVADFLEEVRIKSVLEVEAGEKFLQREIIENSINRPGLALAGFFQYFANKRVQILGLAEHTYLKSLPANDRKIRIGDFFKQDIPCVVLTRNRHAIPDIAVLAVEHEVAVLRSPAITSRFMNIATLALETLSSPEIRVHGTMLDVLGMGVLLLGDAGVGKSETALGLIERRHSLIADDLTILRRESSSGIIRGTASEMTRYHMEIRGLGIIHVPSLFGMASVRREKKLDMVVKLYRPHPDIEAERTGLDEQTHKILGQNLPLVSLPVEVGRDMAKVIEVAAMNQKLKFLGHDAAKELNDKIMNLLGSRRISDDTDEKQA